MNEVVERRMGQMSISVSGLELLYPMIFMFILTAKQPATIIPTCNSKRGVIVFETLPL